MLLRVVIVLAGATVLALLFACQGYVMYLRQGNALPFSTLFAVALVDWWAWAAFLPGLAWLTSRLPVPRSRWLRWTLLLLLVGAAVAAGKMLVNSLLRAAIFDYTLFPLPLAAMWTHLLTFGAIVGFLYARSAARLSALLGRAQLQLLQMQLQPHFLFNTLHAIAALVHDDPAAADRMIVRLGDLLRMSLASTEVEQVPLARELELLEPYLDIQRTRFSDRLGVDIDVPPDARTVKVPSFLLQPLVENAVRHGIAARIGPGRVTIRARRQEGTLRIEVADDGVGPAAPIADGVGLATTRARLQRLYGDAQSLALSPGENGGAVAVVTLPARGAA